MERRTALPFHAELESLLAQPSNLYHQLNSLLGLEDMDVAVARLNHARLAADKESKLAGKDLPGVREAVTGVEDERAMGVSDARAEVDIAVRTARGLVSPVPAVLARAELEQLDTAETSAAWERWAAVPTGDGITGCLQLAEHLLATHPALMRTLVALTVAARDEHRRRQDRWAPLAQRLADWYQLTDRSARAKIRLEQLRKAEEWMKLAAADLRHERLRPFADRTVGLWRELRQSNNVDLVEVRPATTGRSLSSPTTTACPTRSAGSSSPLASSKSPADRDRSSSSTQPAIHAR